MATVRLVGAASSYGNDPKAGVYDSGDNNRPALPGASNNRPGIAVMNRSTLGGYWRVRAPNGKTQVVQQTDLGPAGWTGKKVDINAVAARQLFGYKGGNAFPTGEGKWRLDYLGKNKPAAQTVVRQPQAQQAQSFAPPAPTDPRRDLMLSYLQQRGKPGALMQLGMAFKGS